MLTYNCMLRRKVNQNHFFPSRTLKKKQQNSEADRRGSKIFFREDRSKRILVSLKLKLGWGPLSLFIYLYIYLLIYLLNFIL